MNFLYDMVHNEVLMAPFWGWIIAQILKTLIHMWVTKSFVPERMVGDGGMPSSHSATVMALVTATGINYGGGSYQFALAGIMALIVMHDAMGVRRETGIQAKVLNSMMDFFTAMGSDLLVKEKIKKYKKNNPFLV